MEGVLLGRKIFRAEPGFFPMVLSYTTVECKMEDGQAGRWVATEGDGWLRMEMGG